jgi:hypothetical protein
MRACARWVAAALLVALAFTGGPDALDTGPPASHAQVATGEAEKRDPQVRDDALASAHQVIGLGAPRHLRPAALPPSPHTAVPAPVRGALQAAPEGAPCAATGASDPHLDARTPEALQIFRC